MVKRKKTLNLGRRNRETNPETGIENLLNASAILLQPHSGVAWHKKHIHVYIYGKTINVQSTIIPWKELMNVLYIYKHIVKINQQLCYGRVALSALNRTQNQKKTIEIET